MVICLLRYVAIYGDSIKVPASGEKNTLFGVYRNDCCGFEIVISVGSTFPTCPKHPYHIAQWTQIEIAVAEVIAKKKSKSEPAA